ncbi:MAG: TetR/AcrR family transcriptional regulator [Candidatus Latescibacterota bacterium]
MTPAIVARPREFDIDEALEKAMQLFWTKGYEATSMTDLTTAMGLNKGSLYAAFGSKHDLFIAAIKRYLARDRAVFLENFGGSTPLKDAIRKHLTEYVGTFHKGVLVPRGCLAVNSLAELAASDEEVARLINHHIQGAVSFLTERIRKEQKSGLLETEKDARALAELVIVMELGLLTGTKGPLRGIDDDRLVDVVLQNFN